MREYAKEKSAEGQNSNNSAVGGSAERRGTGRHARCRAEGLESRTLFFAVEVHAAMTAEALPFLRDGIVAEITAEQYAVDTLGAFDSSNHFDNCKFAESVQNINDHLAGAVADGNPANLSTVLGATDFGHALHTAEDFYAHSNWINLGQTSLFDDGSGYWEPATAYSERDGVVIVQGPSPYGDGSVTRDGFVVHVNTGSTVLPGLISGQFGLTPADCPPEAVVSHADLNKDTPDRPLFSEAKALAIEQVRHEFYRLVELVRSTYGSADKLLSEWVKSDSTSQSQLHALLLGESGGKLGSVDSTGVLTLSMGPAAAARGALVGNADGDEAFTVTHVASSNGLETIRVDFNGYSETFAAKSISADGGAGADSLTLVGVTSPISFNGGPGSDQLNLQATGKTNFTLSPTSVNNGVATTSYSGLEQLAVSGSSLADRFLVTGTSAATAVTLKGMGGDDTFVVDSNGDAAGGTVDTLVSKLTIDGGAGTNRVTLQDISDTTADVLHISATQIGAASGDTYFGTGGSIAYANIAAVVASMPSATQGDTIYVAPSQTAVTVLGNGPSSAKDLLIIDDRFGKAKKTITGKDAGVWKIDGFAPVTYSGVEKVQKA